MGIERFRLTAREIEALHSGGMSPQEVADAQLEAIRPSYERLVKALRFCLDNETDLSLFEFDEAEAALKEAEGREK